MKSELRNNPKTKMQFFGRDEAVRAAKRRATNTGKTAYLIRVITDDRQRGLSHYEISSNEKYAKKTGFYEAFAPGYSLSVVGMVNKYRGRKNPTGNVSASTLNHYIGTPVEKWPKSIKLKSYSANADGMVNSGILKSGKHFYKKWNYSNGKHSNPRFVIEGDRDYGNNPKNPVRRRTRASTKKLMAAWMRARSGRGSMTLGRKIQRRMGLKFVKGSWKIKKAKSRRSAR